MNQSKPYQEKREKPWGHEIIYVEPGLPYTGKVEYIKAGCRLSLQYHDVKEESLMLLSGKVLLWLGEIGGEIEKKAMVPLKGYHIGVNKVHRLEALEDSMVLEASTAEGGTTFRIEDDYSRDHERR